MKKMRINRRNMYDSFVRSLAIKVLPCAVVDDKKKESVQKFLNPALRGAIEASPLRPASPPSIKWLTQE